MSYRLEILGSPQIRSSEDAPKPALALGKGFALLSYLVVEDREVSREQLGDLFWPGSDPTRARQSVRQAIWLIRRTLGEEILAGDDPIGVSPSLSSDIRDFRAAVAEGKVDTARKLWRGTLLSRLELAGCREWDRWLEESREVLGTEYFQILLDASLLLKAEGDLEEARSFLEEAITLNPYSLRARAAHIETLIDLNRLAPARNALTEARREVADQEGGPDALEALEAKIQALTSPASSEEPGPAGLVLEFVGRSKELADLKTLWRRVQVGGRGVVSIEGPTGIGKSRLAEEFLKHVEAEGAHVAHVKGYRGEQEIPRGTVSDLVKALLALPGSAGVSSATDTVLRSALPSLSGNGYAGNGGTEPSPTVLSDAVTDLLEAVVFEGPLVVFLDDVQWMDEESRALVARLIRRVQPVPCLFVLAVRTGGDSDVGPSLRDLLLSEGGVRRVTVGALTVGQVGELLTLLAEVLPETEISNVVERIHTVSGGNPLFTTEILRRLVLDGILRGEEGGWVLDAQALPEDLDLPESVQGLIRGRLSRVSKDAMRVASLLASEQRGVQATMLRRRAQMPEVLFTRAVEELVAGEVLAWAGPDVLDFVHDQLREAALDVAHPAKELHPPLSRPVSPWRFLGLAAVLVGAAALVAGLWLGNTTQGEADPPPPTYPYGKGVVLYLADPSVELVPPSREGEAWTVVSSSIAVPDYTASPLRGPFRTPSGELRWFGYFSAGEEPPMAVEVFPDGTHDMILRGRGDAGFHTLSPDGHSALLMQQRDSAEGYAQDLALMDLETGKSRVLYEAEEMILTGTWSPDGQRIALVARGTADTLLVLTPDGRELERHVFPAFHKVTQYSWCPDNHQLALAIWGEDGDYGLLLDPWEGSVRRFGEAFRSITSPLCLSAHGDVLFEGMSEESAGVIFRSSMDGSEIRIHPGIGGRPGGSLRWVPDTITPPVHEIHILADDSALEWGERRRMAAQSIRSSESVDTVPVRWWSENPEVVSITPEGLATGNGPGTTAIVAEYMDWLRDSLVVTVLDEGSRADDLLFRETFGAGGLSNWNTENAVPPPTIQQIETGAVLSLRGDGRFADQISTLESYSLDQGGTLELEVRLPLTDREDHQRFQACLSVEEGSGRRLGALASSGGVLCFRLPAGEGSKLRRDHAVLYLGTPRYRVSIDVAGLFPSDGWIHLALQLRADGKAALYLNRELAYTSEYRVPMEDGARWRIELSGAARDTELLVRDLVLWRGERFSTDPSEGGG